MAKKIAKNKGIKFNYKGGVFIFVDRINGYNFIHELSGHGCYNAIFYERFGRPTVNNYTDVFAKFIESDIRRVNMINQYVNKYDLDLSLVAGLSA